MMTLAEKCGEAAGNLSHLYGEFTVFSLVQWERSAGKWDVVVSAPWLTVSREGIQRIVYGLEQSLSSEDWLEIASVIPFRPETPFVETMLRIFGSRFMEQIHQFPENMIQESGPFIAQDFRVDRAFVIIANKPPIVMQAYTLAPA